MTGATALENLLRRERWIVAAGLFALTALAWAYVLSGAGMGVRVTDATIVSLFPHKTLAPLGSMPGMDMPSMDAAEGGRWSVRTWLLTIGMWAAMMVAMMTPSAAPAILLYGRVAAHAEMTGRQGGVASTGIFAAGYLLLWLMFSVLAAVLHWALELLGLLSPAAMGSQSRWLSAALLLGAGVYQLSPLKNACLTQCRSPAQFLSRHWRPGPAGAVQLGLLHGAYCIGCCWILMSLLFLGGVMNLAWIAALTLLVVAEKLSAPGVWIGRAAGAVLILWGAVTIFV